MARHQNSALIDVLPPSTCISARAQTQNARTIFANFFAVSTLSAVHRFTQRLTIFPMPSYPLRTPSPMNTKQTSPLAQPFTLPCGLEIKNRTLKSAMSETLSRNDNAPPQTISTLYRRWAQGGLGISVTGNVMVDRRALGEPGNIAVEDDTHLDTLRAWADAGRTDGCTLFAQLNHPGRQVPRFMNKESVSPSAIPFRKDMQAMFSTPRALREDEVEDIIQRFATTASVFARAGFDGVQIHGAHGYLVSQFLSPHTNRRTDKWGGSEENRRRFALEIARAIRKETPDSFALSIKINSADFQKGGISEDASADTIQALVEEGVDLVEISGGTYEAPAMMASKKSTRDREAYFLRFAEALREHVSAPLAVTGGFRSGAAMNEAIESGAIDFVGLARPLVVHTDLPNALFADPTLRIDLPARKTGIRFIDRAGMVEIAWYERQIHRLAQGKEPRPNENPLLSLSRYMFTHGLNGLQRRRGR